MFKTCFYHNTIYLILTRKGKRFNTYLNVAVDGVLHQSVFLWHGQMWAKGIPAAVFEQARVPVSGLAIPTISELTIGAFKHCCHLYLHQTRAAAPCAAYLRLIKSALVHCSALHLLHPEYTMSGAQKALSSTLLHWFQLCVIDPRYHSYHIWVFLH